MTSPIAKVITSAVIVISVALPISYLFADNDLYIDENGAISDSNVVNYAAPNASYSADGTKIIVDGEEAVSRSSIASPIDQNNIDMGEGDYRSGSNESLNSTSGGPIKVYTSEIIPGADCWCVDDAGVRQDSANKACSVDTPVQKRKYECSVKSGLGSFQSMFASIIRYFVNIVLILGVLAIVGLGIAWSVAGGDDAKAKSSLKKWGINIVVGLIILFMFQYILKFLAPWIYQ